MKATRWGCGCLALVLVLIMAMPLMLLADVSAGSSPVGNVTGSGAIGKPVPIPLISLFPWTPSGGEPILAGYPEGQCTWFVSYEGHAGGNHHVTWGGDAWEWYSNATAAGVATQPASARPQVGWIAVFARGHGSSEFGHVAVVVAVDGPTFTIAEMNVLGLGVADVRTLVIGGASPVLEGWIV